MKTKTKPKTRIPVWVVMQEGMPLDCCIRNCAIRKKEALSILAARLSEFDAKLKKMVLIDED